MSTLKFPRIDPSIPCDVTASWNFTGGLKVNGADITTGGFDPTSDQTITGAWNFTGGIKKGGVDVATIDDAFDTAEDYDVTGKWTFEDTHVLIKATKDTASHIRFNRSNQGGIVEPGDYLGAIIFSGKDGPRDEYGAAVNIYAQCTDEMDPGTINADLIITSYPHDDRVEYETFRFQADGVLQGKVSEGVEVFTTTTDTDALDGHTHLNSSYIANQPSSGSSAILTLSKALLDNVHGRAVEFIVSANAFAEKSLTVGTEVQNIYATDEYDFSSRIQFDSYHNLQVGSWIYVLGTGNNHMDGRWCQVRTVETDKNVVMNRDTDGIHYGGTAVRGLIDNSKSGNGWGGNGSPPNIDNSKLMHPPKMMKITFDGQNYFYSD